MRYKSFDKRDRPGGLANWLGLMTLAILAVTSQTAPAQNTTFQDELAELYGPGESGPVRVQPTTLNPEDVDIGLTLPDLEFADINGNISRLSDLLQGKHALIVAVRDTACPVSSRYAPRLGELERELLEHQVGFLFLNPGPHDNLARIRREIESNHLKGPYVHDKSG